MSSNFDPRSVQKAIKTNSGKYIISHLPKISKFEFGNPHNLPFSTNPDTTVQQRSHHRKRLAPVERFSSESIREYFAQREVVANCNPPQLSEIRRVSANELS